MEVYKITNTINQKLYIGQTVKTAKKDLKTTNKLSKNMSKKEKIQQNFIMRSKKQVQKTLKLKKQKIVRPEKNWTKEKSIGLKI